MDLVRLGFKENWYRESKILNGKTIFQRCRPIQEDILIIFCIACHSGHVPNLIANIICIGCLLRNGINTHFEYGCIWLG